MPMEPVGNHEPILAASRKIRDLEYQLAALRDAARKMVSAHKRWQANPTPYLAGLVLEARDELAALDAAGRS